ncbi:MAG: HEAT repeat domain-containing protein [Planctomycetota bacterium]
MESARPNALRSFVIIAVAFSVGYLIANPAGTVWRARYWLPFGDRNSALERLVEVEPGGAESELTHAIETDDPALQLTAAEALAARGDKRGLETLVALCGDAEESPPRTSLEGILDDPKRLNDFDSVKEWFDSNRHVLRCTKHALWKEQGDHGE